MNLIDAAKQALGWMECCGDGDSPTAYNLRAAIEQAEKVEPEGQNSKWCSCCKKNDHTDSECHSTRPKRRFSDCHPAPIPECWQPIETVPKDGTEMLICTREGCRYVVSYDNIFTAPWRIRNDQGLNEHIPVLWMPLPAAPKPEEK